VGTAPTESDAHDMVDAIVDWSLPDIFDTPHLRLVWVKEVLK
jgi:hypothetical protein